MIIENATNWFDRNVYGTRKDLINEKGGIKCNNKIKRDKKD